MTALPAGAAQRTLLLQATTRLIVSLVLAMAITVAMAGWLYVTTQDKAARAELAALQQSYQRKMVELENDWETRALRLKSGIEYTRILEDRRKRWHKLYGYLTAQGEQAAFSHLAITGADDQLIFRFGPGAEFLPDRIAHTAAASWHYQPESGALFRVYFQPIWLGEQEGMGHLALFLLLDNALLYRNAAPQTDLFLMWGGQRVASSLGPAADLAQHPVPAGAMQARLRWPGSGDKAPELVIRHVNTAPVPIGEIVTGALLALAALLGVLWAVQGLWMLRLTRRVAALGKASEEFAHGYAVSAQLRQHLDSADGKQQDEISRVAHSLESLTVAVMEREAERNTRETELRESETRVREISESLGDGVIVVDADGTISFMNRKAEQLLGWKEQELLGQDSHDNTHYLTPDGRPNPVAACPLHRAIRLGEEFRSGLDYFVRKDKSIFPASLVATPMFRAGAIKGSVVTFQDISERLKSEEIIRESEKRFRQLFNSGSDAILVHAILPDGHPGNFVEVNDIACRRLGYAREELFRMSPEDIDAPASGRADDPEMLRELRENRHALFERVHVAKDGRHIPVEINAHLFVLAGRDTVLAVARDITERRLAEQALRDSRDQLEERVRERTAELQTANAALHDEKAHQEALVRKLEAAQNQLLQSEKMASIGQLAAGVAHEINNPVGFINSNVGSLERYLKNVFAVLDAYEREPAGHNGSEGVAVAALKREIDFDFLKEDIFSLIHETKDGVARVKKIVQDLKDFSHVDEAEWQWADLHKGLDSTLNVVNNEIKYKAKVVKEYAELPEVECLPFQLNQVFMNLLVNAAHAIAERGTITVRTGTAGGEVWVEVVDTGSGIAPENMKRIFDPFFTTKPVGKGTGLGLSLSYGIVQKHHGRIEVKSELGKGSAFRVILPVQQAAAAANAGARQQA